MQKEIAVTKRSHLQGQEQVQSLEKAKEGQDLYVNNVTRARVLGERIAVTEARLAKQQDESRRGSQTPGGDGPGDEPRGL